MSGTENQIETLFKAFAESLQQQQFVKLTLSDKRNKELELKNVFVKPVQLKQGLKFSFVSRYPTKDVTKNYDPADAGVLLRSMLEKEFFKADLFTAAGDYHFASDKSGKSYLKRKAASLAAPVALAHDEAKMRTINAAGNIYLHELGVTTSEGKVKSDKQDKYRQINKYVEIVESVVKEANLPASFSVVDMGAGKGYLTFALYDYLTNTMNLKPEITGVELRQ